MLDSLDIDIVIAPQLHVLCQEDVLMYLPGTKVTLLARNGDLAQGEHLSQILPRTYKIE